jgi:hypothetical protein
MQNQYQELNQHGKLSIPGPTGNTGIRRRDFSIVSDNSALSQMNRNLPDNGTGIDIVDFMERESVSVASSQNPNS